jgi:asparagine synthase (glutamine-hydrolysing)
MCGIAGFMGRASRDQLNDLMLRMSRTLTHRGPNDSGVWLDEIKGIALSHRRLSVLDLSSSGHQPMVSHSSRYVISFNGEIYNHQELRLLCPGISWRGSSDTETLVALFDHFGIDQSLKLLRGMFSLAVWDRENEQLILARDPLGEKPLYYSSFKKNGENYFIFGSELKAILAHDHFASEIDTDALGSYFRFGNFGSEKTIYKGVKKLLPGHFLSIHQKDFRIHIDAYYSIKDQISSDVFLESFDSASNTLDGLINQTVKDQMLSDVPIGSFLSGGVDSSLITAVMQSNSTSKIKSFSIGFEEREFDEAPEAKKIASYLGTDHTELYVSSKEAMAVIPKLSSIYDEPFADSSAIPTYLVSHLAKTKVTVALSGDGGDELFGGYNRYIFVGQFWSKLKFLPFHLRKIVSFLILSTPHHKRHFIFEKLFFGQNIRHLSDKLHKAASVLDAKDLKDLYLKLIGYWPESESPLLSCFGKNPFSLTKDLSFLANLDDRQQIMFWDMANYLPDDILVKVDRASMAVGLEARSPYLDQRIVKYALNLPMKFKIDKKRGGYETKKILRSVLSKYMPLSLIDKPKSGFAIPIDQWLRGPLKSWAEDLLSQSKLQKESYLNVQLIRRKWSEHLNGTKNWGPQLWAVLVFEMWLENHAKEKNTLSS